MRPRTIPNASIAAMALLLVLCAIIISQGTFALRASPAQIIIPQGSDGAFAIRVLDATDPSQVTVTVGGDLADNVALDALYAHPEGGIAITGRLTIPDDAAPGDHVQELIIGIAGSSTEGTVAARAEIAIPLIARVPYPDAYLVADWNAQPDPATSETRFIVTLENRGSVTVTTGSVSIGFTDGERELPPLSLASATIAPGTFAGLNGAYAMPSDARPGEYDATLLVPYAGTTLAQSKEIILGAPRITIDRVAYDTTESGEIVPVDIDGRIDWNSPIALDVAVFLDDQAVPAASERASAVQDAFSRRLYVDTTRAGRANASVRVAVSAGGVTVERVEPIVVHAPSRRSSTRAPLMLGGGVLAIILLLILLLLRWWRKRIPPPPSISLPGSL